MTTTEKQWIVDNPAPEEFRLEHPELPDVVLQLLWNRDLRTQKQIDAFLNPDYSRDIHDPFLFTDMKKAVDRLFAAIKNNETIVVHGDYDADGVSATIILDQTLRALGAVPQTFLPHRQDDGYGLSMHTVERFAENGAKIIITCDCGISNTKEIQRAQELGVDVIVTDHHQQPPELPKAFAIIHPKIDGEAYPFKGLAGGGVAFKLAQGLLVEHAKNNAVLKSGTKHDIFEKWLLDMVAISSVADMVPLRGETRTLVRYGLLVLEKTQRIGLRKLMKTVGALGRDGKPKRGPIDSEDIGFKIAPRINAAGRISHAQIAYDLLACDQEEHAGQLAQELNDINRARQDETARLTKLAKEYVKKTAQESDPVVVVCGEGWSTGLVGLIASRIKDVYNRPTFVVANNDGELVGSGRSVPGFNMYEGMRSIEHCFDKFGGHPQACGFTLKKDVTAEAFKQAISPLAKESTEEDPSPQLRVDAAVSLDHITWQLYDHLERFEPFGMENARPIFVASNCRVISVEPVGKTGKHVRLHVQHNTGVVRKTIFFNGSKWLDQLAADDLIDMVFEVGVNEWNGNRELQLKIIDLKKVTQTATQPPGQTILETSGAGV